MSAMDEIPPRLDMLEPSRFNPQQQMRIVGYHMDAVRRALAGGTFRSAVRQAQMLAEIIRLAAILEDREFRDHPSPLIYHLGDHVDPALRPIFPTSHSDRTTEDPT